MMSCFLKSIFPIFMSFLFAYVVFANSEVSKTRLRMKRQAVFTKSSKYFFRFNGKLNTLNFTTLVAFGYTLRMNWDLPHDTKNRFMFFKRDIHDDISNIPDDTALQGFSCALKHVCQMYASFVESNSCGFFCQMGKMISAEKGYEAQFFKNIVSKCDHYELLCPQHSPGTTTISYG